MTAVGNVEEIVPGLSRESLRNGCILVLHFTASSRTVVDAWYQTMRDTYENCQPDQPFLCLQDMTHPNIEITSYARVRSVEMAKLNPEIKGRIAVVMSKSLATHLMRGFLNLLNSNSDSRERRIFLSHDEALAWLAELIPQ